METIYKVNPIYTSKHGVVESGDVIVTILSERESKPVHLLVHHLEVDNDPTQ
jgi:hypothetical protein